MKLDDNYSYKPSYDPFEGVMTRNGLPADEVISALQKSIRHADEDTAVRCGYEMYVTSPELDYQRGGYRVWGADGTGADPDA